MTPGAASNCIQLSRSTCAYYGASHILATIAGAALFPGSSFYCTAVSCIGVSRLRLLSLAIHVLQSLCGKERITSGMLAFLWEVRGKQAVECKIETSASTFGGRCNLGVWF